MKGRKIILLDSCHSGNLELGSNSENLTDEMRQNLQMESVCVITACNAEGESYAPQFAPQGEELHTYFGSALLKGLKGDADTDKVTKGEITFTELASYIKTVNDAQHLQSPTYSVPSIKDGSGNDIIAMLN
jgi:hypothetical protein